jgi:hypothetical protein
MMWQMSTAILLSGITFVWAGDLPDSTLTPGACKSMDIHTLCTTKWGKDARHVTAAMKAKVFQEYGLTDNSDTSDCEPDKHGRHHEVDHLCSRELGGEDVVENLWPQCYSGKWNAVMKDRLENRLHKEVCAGEITLPEAQRAITSDWIKAYKERWPQ